MCNEDCNQGRACTCSDEPLYTFETVVDMFILALISILTALIIAVPFYLTVTQ